MEQRMTQDECCGRLQDIQRVLSDHIGEPALVRIKDGRSWQAMIAVLEDAKGKVYARYNIYEKDGRLRGARRLYVNPSLVLTGELKIEYFDDGV